MQSSASVTELVNKKLVSDAVTLQRQKDQLLKENELLKKENRKLRSEIQNLKQQDSRCLKQKLKRRENTINLWKAKLNKLKQQTRATKVMAREKKMRELQHKLASLKKSQKKSSKTKLCRKVGLKCLRNLNDALLDQKKQLKEQQRTIVFYDDQLAQACQPSSPLKTMTDGKSFDPVIRETCYILQDSGVAQSRVSSCLRKVAKSFTGKDLGTLPSYTSQNKFTHEMRALSQQQVQESLSSSQMTTLKFDGTTKRSGHLVEVEAATDSGQTLLLGLRQQPGGTADEYVNTIEQLCEKSDLRLDQVANTMTDRCVTNSAIHRKLEERKGAAMNEFKCAMHPLDTMSKDCDKAVKNFEAVVEHPITGTQLYKNRSESVSQALVRNMTKLFHNTKYYNEDLHTHLSLKFGNENLYYRFVGSRFHLYFLCSGMLFTYLPCVKDFFEHFSKPKNPLESAVYSTLKWSPISTTLKALGLIGKSVTGPWMRLVEQPQLRILDMNEYFEVAVQRLEGKVGLQNVLH